MVVWNYTRKKKHEIPQVDANDILSNSITENEDENIEKSTNHNAATANDVLMALNTLGSSVTEVNDQIKSIIKWSNHYIISKFVFQFMLFQPSIYRWE